MKPVQIFCEENPKVNKWIQASFHDDGTRNVYCWHLAEITAEMKLRSPDAFLKLDPNRSSTLYVRLKQHLIELSQQHPRKASQMKAAIQKFCRFHSNRPGKFTMDIPLKMKATYQRPYWTLKELQQVLSCLTLSYRPLVWIGAMSGLGRKELVYLNQHLEEAKPVPTFEKEAYYLDFPARKSNERFWKAILPAKELEKLKARGPFKTTQKTEVDELNLTQQFRVATKRAEMQVTGTGIHVLRSIFESVGHNAGIPEDVLQENMGHVIDKLHYNRTDQDLPRRAKALIPLWEYFRRGGPEAAQSHELEKTKVQVEEVSAKNKELTDLLTKQGAEIKDLQEVVGFLAKFRREIFMKDLETRAKQRKPGKKPGKPSFWSPVMEKDLETFFAGASPRAIEIFRKYLRK